MPEDWTAVVMATVHQCSSCGRWMIGTDREQCRDCYEEPVKMGDRHLQPSLFNPASSDSSSS
jgi:hypothetical protein